MLAFIFGILAIGSSAIKVSEEPESAVPNGYKLFTFPAFIDNWSYNGAFFNLRYYINTNYWNATLPGPIFFYCGGNGAIEAYMSNTGYIDSLAQQMQAIVVYAEHRYFGSSLPFGNISFTPAGHAKYLSPHQAIADFAYLITSLEAAYDQAPVIVWGGGYGGMLAAWMRLTYSNLVRGAIASSAPVLAFNGTVDPNAFNAFVTSVYASQVPECPAIIAVAFDNLRSLYGNETAYERLTEIFQPCSPIQSIQDVVNLSIWLQNAFVALSIFNYPYPTSVIYPIPSNPVAQACEMVKYANADDFWETIEVAASVGVLYYNMTGLNVCANLNNLYANSNFGIESGWSYITCSTLNMPMGSSKATSMFGDLPWDQVDINNACLTAWNTTPEINYASQWYGASNNPGQTWQYASNIVFSNGGLDPWQVGSVTKTFGDATVAAFVVDGAASMMDLMSPNPNDPPQLSAARATEKIAIQYWLYGLGKINSSLN
ncbi:unnamed protein product [Blepharisma stoltei]|uniref:Lysosomal Pro-X carboxypeptidase n=1 Tax=Blepharisma stoltei TaxID=1481888 RepID=A0AAU9IGB6_9CILI|nr:unnamed protein product [Blepharisma stoltei]